MSEIKALEKLREYAAYNCRVTGWKDDLKALADAIEAEVAESYMRLPNDADGTPIHVGDVVEFGENRYQGIVKSLNEHMVIAMHVNDVCMNYAKYGLLWNADACRHVKARTLEDVLCDVWKEALDYAKSDMWRNPDEAFAERADEIRAMFGEVD